MAQLHIFSEFAGESVHNPTVIGDTACVTGDPERMYALYQETEDAIRRARAAGHATIGQVLEVPFFELEAEAAAAVDNRGADYYEQMLALDASRYEAKAA